MPSTYHTHINYNVNHVFTHDENTILIQKNGDGLLTTVLPLRLRATLSQEDWNILVHMVNNHISNYISLSSKNLMEIYKNIAIFILGLPLLSSFGIYYIIGTTVEWLPISIMTFIGGFFYSLFKATENNKRLSSMSKNSIVDINKKCAIGNVQFSLVEPDDMTSEMFVKY